jgi:hypothetical protein
VKYSDIDVDTIIRLSKVIRRLRKLMVEDYPALRNFYLEKDKELITCLTAHRALTSEMKKFDFAYLSPVCFCDKAYITNRINKMDKGYTLLLDMYRGR